MKIKRLFLDLETSPLIVLSWKTGYKIFLNYDNIIHERKIIIASYKWEGEKNAHVLVWDKNQDDGDLLRQLVPIMDEADEIVGHWLDNFDMPWVKTRCLVHRIPTKPVYVTIDTCKWARRYFYFNSAKLDYLAKLLGIGSKIRTEDGLWRRVVLNKCMKSLAFMCKYAKKDVVLLESVFHRLTDLVPHRTHVGVLLGNDKWTCAKCGSDHTISEKKKVTATGMVKWQMRCKPNGHYYTISSKAHDDYLKEKLRKERTLKA